MLGRSETWPLESVREVSLAWEAATGCDSIDTIERVYDQSKGGAFVCCFPGCTLALRDPAKLWFHIHGSRHHGDPMLPPPDFDWGAYF